MVLAWLRRRLRRPRAVEGPIEKAERVGDIAKAVSKRARELQQLHGDVARRLGYVSERMESFGPCWYAAAAGPLPDDAPIQSGLDMVNSISKSLDGLTPAPDLLIAESLEVSAHIFSVTTTMIQAAYVPNSHALPDLAPSPYGGDSSQETVSTILDRLDPGLGATYRGAWAALNAGYFDAKRGAMYQMRQAYDHLFDLLAPDARVLESEFFVEKAPPRQGQVDRAERIRYAANVHIRDASIRDVLTGGAEATLKAHGALSAAHKRGELDEARARKAVNAMDKFIAQWATAVAPSWAQD